MDEDTLVKVVALRKVKFLKCHYHPLFLENMERNIRAGRDLGYNAHRLIDRSFWKHFPGGLKSVQIFE